MSTVMQRQAWMATLAKADLELLEKLVNKLGNLPKYSFLRSPEIGLAMVRGRAGGTGQAFNLGEITMTRCVVQLDPHFSQTVGAGSQISSITHEYLAKPAPTDFEMRLQESCEKSGLESQGEEAIPGFGYVAGRSHRHAELAAVCDALLQIPNWHDQIQAEIIQPLQAEYQKQQELKQRQAAATQVNFFTMVRGEG